ncbi:MAG: hypothetical protein OXS29_00040 [bacterium]|nr:hypothetical protein [bacterium]MDE0288069.1 hypothetical protein [bacterium]MDE0438516.1 hypothetical protein [bacterium]
MNQSYSARFADLVEGIARRVRALTVERLATAITFTALGMGVVLLIVAALVLACMGIFRLLAVGVGTTAAYAILGGLFLVAGWLTWRRRTPAPEESSG